MRYVPCVSPSEYVRPDNDDDVDGCGRPRPREVATLSSTPRATCKRRPRICGRRMTVCTLAHEAAAETSGPRPALATRRGRLAAAGVALLHRRTLHRPVRAEDAAVAGLGAQQGLALAALVVEQAGIRRHCLLRGKAAVRAGQHRFEHDRVHRWLNGGLWRDSPRWSWP